MSISFPDHQFQITTCLRSGRECPVARAFAERLVQAARLACSVRPGFEMTGRAMLDGCAAGGEALFVLNARRVELFCGIEKGEDAAALCAFSAAFFEDRDARGPLSRLIAPPRMMLRAPVRATPRAAMAVCEAARI